jgi:hypothetical protein
MASPKRLSGRKMTFDEIAFHLMVSQHDSMHAALEKFDLGQHKYQARKRNNVKLPASVPEQMLAGDSNLPRLLAEADALIDEVLLEDPRLVRRAGWVVDEEGVDVDPVRLAMGEERCCLNRRKMRMADAATVEPIRIVISTDSKSVDEKHAVAFIAAAKIAQQFRPLEIWWQGAWLSDQPEHAGCGHVLLTPLVKGELDFARLQFVLSSPLRDSVSYRIMYHYATLKPVVVGWGAKEGEYSYLPDTFEFINERGIQHDAYRVAAYAARWAGLEPAYTTRVSDSSAVQSWTEPYKYVEPTEKEKKEREKYWAEQDAKRKREEATRAKERMTAIV